VDDIARGLFLPAGKSPFPRQIVFLVWVTFGEQKWVILAERRGPETSAAVHHRLQRYSMSGLSGQVSPVAMRDEELHRRIGDGLYCPDGLSAVLR
jgi:hypothetical protein